jgi:WD40 repeat protein
MWPVYAEMQGRNPGKELTSRAISYDTQDSMYDTTWSELNEHHIVVACGDGSVKLFDTTQDNFPLVSWQEHNREVYAVSWNLVSKDTFASSSWDGTIKIVYTTNLRASPRSGQNT